MALRPANDVWFGDDVLTKRQAQLEVADVKFSIGSDQNGQI